MLLFSPSISWPILGKILRPLLGRAQADENLREAVRTRWVEPRRQVAREIVCRGIQSGELRPGLDPDVVFRRPVWSLLSPLAGAVQQRAISDRFYRGASRYSIRWTGAGGAKALVQSDPQDD